MEIRECGKASCARMGRLFSEGKDRADIGYIPLMPSAYAGGDEWAEWLKAMQAWVNHAGGDDQEGVMPKAEAVVASLQRLWAAR